MAYKKAEYIQSNGTYFRTGIIHGTNPKVKVDFTVVSNYTSSNNYVFGVMSPSYYSNGTIALNIFGSSRMFRYYIGGAYNDNAADFTIGDRYECTLDKTALLVNNKTTLSSTTVTISGSNPSATTQDYVIGALNEILDNKGITTPSNIYIYEVTIYEGDSIVAHYLPYGDTETGYGLLYDTVSGYYLIANEPSKTTAFFQQFLEPESMSFDYTGGSSALTIYSESGWTASTNNSWISLSSLSGSGDSSITVTIAQNATLQAKLGTINVTNGVDTATCSISQEKHPKTIISNGLHLEDTKINKMYLNGDLIYQNVTKNS